MIVKHCSHAQPTENDILTAGYFYQDGKIVRRILSGFFRDLSGLSDSCFTGKYTGDISLLKGDINGDASRGFAQFPIVDHNSRLRGAAQRRAIYDVTGLLRHCITEVQSNCEKFAKQALTMEITATIRST